MQTKLEWTPEQELLILTSRLTFSENQKEQLTTLLSENRINWFEFYKLTLYHKTTTLCWKNIKTYCPDVSIPKYLREVITSASISIAERNKNYQLKIKEALDEFKKHDLTCIPVKGSYLIPNMYKDYGIRYSGDADFLVKYSDIAKLGDAMESLGFIKSNGIYNEIDNTITPISRAEEIMWKRSMSNLPPYLKLNDNRFTPFYLFDFRFALDDTLNHDPINEIIDNYIRTGHVNPSHVLTHLCTHFYGEATYTLTIFFGKDMSLIKLCDIREYIIQCMDNVSLESCVSFAKKNNLEKQIYYTMFYLKLVYNDGYEDEIMEKLGVVDQDFMREFGENQLGEKQKFKKGFYERIFSCDNSDEMLEGPRFLEI
ncbi:nucleotidyltransferase family protein [Paenibacillus sp. FSL R5-0766]|uniref:nucleotidyltransferase family protein n=1 Tax=unclassified Paenibacillus TaxID=185978 RepID=UPI00096C7AF1|nr:nucleotidyltransferase family protein [Paenibacillus sp. FSL R5-0765]OMF59913.1 hypothetical protein BK141_23915 [Paenibacillus sp. FSL R5-0765]